METMNAAQFLSALGRTSMQAGVLVLVVLLAQWFFRRRLTPRWRCALWLLVVVRLMLPLSLTSSASIFNWLPDWNGRATPATLSPGVNLTPTPASLETSFGGLVDQPVVTKEIPSAQSVVGVETEQAAVPPASVGTNLNTPATGQISWTTVAVVIWFVGVVALLTQVLVSAVRLARRFAHLPPVTNPAVLAVLEDCRKLLGVRARLMVVESGDVSSPALQGLIRPQLLLPKKFAGNFSLRELRHIFLHELAHVKRRDLWLNWLVALLQVAHWFNPLVWIAFARWRADRELACDALALEAAGAEQNREYGRTMLRLLESFTPRVAVPGMVGIFEDKQQLRQRIQMIAQFRPASRWSVLALLLVAVIAAGCLTDAKTTHAVGTSSDNPAVNSKSSRDQEPLMLDLSGFYRQWFVTGDETNADVVTIAGRRVIDGVPFQIDGRALLYGKKEAAWQKVTITDFPDFLGIPVGRKFDELHLIHATFWPDVDGQAIALIRLNYADGATCELPIVYGGQVRNWQRNRTEEKEFLTDPNSKIIWRDSGIPQYLSTQRMFKSVLVNPYPQKPVASMDFVSTRHLASYDLMAATVVNHDSHRSLTPPCPADEPERHFDGTLTIRVVDEATGHPIQGALVDTYIDMDGPLMITAPLYTSAAGEAVVRYPTGRETNITVAVEMPGYATKHARWSLDFPETAAFRLVRETNAGPTDPLAENLKFSGAGIQSSKATSRKTSANGGLIAYEGFVFSDGLKKADGSDYTGQTKNATIAGTKPDQMIAQGRSTLIANGGLVFSEGFKNADGSDYNGPVTIAGTKPVPVIAQDHPIAYEGFKNADGSDYIPPTEIARGRPVIGHLERSGDLGPDADLSQCVLVLQPDVKPPPVPEEMKTQEKVQEWYDGWRKTDAGRQYFEAMSRMRQVRVKADGTFRVEAVAPGKYRLSGSLLKNGALLAQVDSVDVVILESTSNAPAAPFDLGPVTLKAMKHLNTGDVVPDFDVKTLDDKPLKLSDFRGKYVLLDFWATWCGPCVAEMPNLKAIYDAYGKDERFVMISLSLDMDAAAPKKFVQDKNLQWLQGFLGDWSKDNVAKDYGIYGIPSIFLIGPDGKLIAQGLRGARIKEVVGSTLMAR